MKIHVGFDCDGVFRKLREHIINCFLNQNPSLKSKFKDPYNAKEWDLKDAIIDDENNKIYTKIKRFAFEDSETSYKIFKSAPCYEDTFQFSRYFKLLNKLGCTVSICSKQVDSWRKHGTLQWLNKNNMPHDNLIFCNEDNKHYFGFDYLIDDKPQNVIGVDQYGKAGFLMKRPWNSTDRNRIKYKVDSVEKFVEHILNKELD